KTAIGLDQAVNRSIRRMPATGDLRHFQMKRMRRLQVAAVLEFLGIRRGGETLRRRWTLANFYVVDFQEHLTVIDHLYCGRVLKAVARPITEEVYRFKSGRNFQQRLAVTVYTKALGPLRRGIHHKAVGVCALSLLALDLAKRQATRIGIKNHPLPFKGLQEVSPRQSQVAGSGHVDLVTETNPRFMIFTRCNVNSVAVAVAKVSDLSFDDDALVRRQHQIGLELVRKQLRDVGGFIQRLNELLRSRCVVGPSERSAGAARNANQRQNAPEHAPHFIYSLVGDNYWLIICRSATAKTRPYRETSCGR